jgi:hypothetical protein
VSHESRLGRIEQLLADMLHPQRELPSDEVLAQAFGQTLALYARDGNMDAAVELAKTLFPDADAAWVKDNFGPDVFDGHDEARWAAFKLVQKGVHAGSSLEQFVGTSTTTKITTQRPLTREVELA